VADPLSAGNACSELNKADAGRIALLIVLSLFLWAMLAMAGQRFLTYPDAMEYAQVARSLNEGQGAKTQTLWTLRLAYPLKEFPAPDVRRPLLWPLAIAGFFKIFGAVDWPATLASALVGGLGAGMVYVIARRWFHPREALLAGIIYLFQPRCLMLHQSALSEPMFSFLLLVVAWSWLKAESPWQFLALGLLTGLTQWVRLNGYLLALPILAWLLWTRKSGWKANSPAFAAGVILAVLPIAIRNQIILGDFSIIGIARYSIVGEVGGFPDHGAERSLESISPLAVFAAHPAEVFRKYLHGLSKNLTAALSAFHPLLLGLCLLPVIRRRGIAEASRLSRLALAVLVLFWATFSIGEFEGERFYVPLTPLILLGALAGLKAWGKTAEVNEPADRRIFGLPVTHWTGIALILVLPGFFTLGEATRGSSADMAESRQALRSVFSRALPESSAVAASDVPWAVGWYGRRTAFWLPNQPEQIEALEAQAGLQYIVLSSAVFGPDWSHTRWPAVFRGQHHLPGYRAVTGPESGFVILKRTE
jgi:4-amino-4-deoxy-L-arabinose transferase-like glycosyltransferase